MLPAARVMLDLVTGNTALLIVLRTASPNGYYT